jgi:Phage portal protein
LSKFTDRIRHAWNALRFSDENPQLPVAIDLGSSSSYRPDRQRFRFTYEKTIIDAIYTRLAIDVAAVPIRHVRVDDDRKYQEDISSGLNECLTVRANIDQGARMFRQDMALTLFDDGVIAIVPVDTTADPTLTNSYDIQSMRVGRIMNWYPKHVTVRVYNENKGIQQDITLPKSIVAIVENPLYTVMNEHSSTLRRLQRKLNLLDVVDEQSASGKLDIIIQLPYVVKTVARREEATKRLQEIEFQLKNSQHGIAYSDATEKITQLNRPVENNLMAQVEYLTKMLYGQLGLTEEVMNGTADEATMINYYNRSVEPILGALTEGMAMTFLTKTARSQGQAVIYIRDPFKLVPVKDLAEIVDKFTRNEVASSNDMRSVIGWRPSKDPKADKLLNKNIPAPAPAGALPRSPAPTRRTPVINPMLKGVVIPPALPGQGNGNQRGVNSQNGT